MRCKNHLSLISCLFLITFGCAKWFVMRGKVIICAALALVIIWTCRAEGKEDVRFNEAVLVLTGAGEIEELDEYEIDRYLRLSSNPLRLNSSGRPALLSSGLMTLYQIVSFLDYRTLSGPVMSFSELASIDGFNERVAQALSLFVILDNPDAPARRKIEATEKLYERHYLVIKIVSSFFACLIKFLYL